MPRGAAGAEGAPLTGSGADGVGTGGVSGATGLPLPPCGWMKLGEGEDCACPTSGSMAKTGADGCAAPDAGIGIGGKPGLRFGDSGGCSAGTPGSEL